METKSGFYPMTTAILGVLIKESEKGDKNVLAASIGVTVSCLDQWLRGTTKQIRADNYVALCVQYWDKLIGDGWTEDDALPEFTLKRYGKTMVELRSEYVVQGEKFLMNLRSAKQRESKSNGVAFMCAECGKTLSTKVMTKGGSFVVGVERCQTCNGMEAGLACKVQEMASLVVASSKDLLTMGKRLETLAAGLKDTAKDIEKPSRVLEQAPATPDGPTAETI